MPKSASSVTGLGSARGEETSPQMYRGTKPPTSTRSSCHGSRFGQMVRRVLSARPTLWESYSLYVPNFMDGRSLPNRATRRLGQVRADLSFGNRDKSGHRWQGASPESFALPERLPRHREREATLCRPR